MKTALYNPIFINPQAYYVFPQLYNIVPEVEQLIEPAIFSGTLIVLNSDNTILRRYANTKSIDLSDFANSIVTISLYTDIGNTVLGQWKLSGKTGPKFNSSLIDAWFMSGFNNEDKPTHINGIDNKELILNNFAFAGMSGFNGYRLNYNYINGIFASKTTSKITFNRAAGTSQTWLGGMDLSKYDNTVDYDVNVDLSNFDLPYIYIAAIEGNVVVNRIPLYQGINTINPLDVSKATDLSAVRISYIVAGIGEVTVEQIPLYEGGLVFDGVDDYAICNNMPIQTDYTVICRRIINADITDPITQFAVASKSHTIGLGAFILEYDNSSENANNISCTSFSTIKSVNNIINVSDSVTYQTSTSYNGTPISKGTSVDNSTLYLGCIRLSNDARLLGVIYYFAIYDKSLTLEEIEAEKIALEEEWNKRKNK